MVDALPSDASKHNTNINTNALLTVGGSSLYSVASRPVMHKNFQEKQKTHFLTIWDDKHPYLMSHFDLCGILMY